jgi:inositol transport system ATP-binding protein
LTATLEAREISKSFPGAKVLDRVSLRVGKGEVHALVGENGAGKSTLAKIIAGIYAADAGEILIEGKTVRVRNAHEALRLGIAMIHQELMPFPELSVAENICMGREPTRGFAGWLDTAAMRTESRRLLERLGVRVDPDSRMGDLSVAEMQAVEIAKALGYHARVILMDEPTSALSDREVDALLRLIRDLKQQGASIVLISHRMKEIFHVADAVTVLRDGKHIATHAISEVDEDRLIALMVGRDLGELFAEPAGSVSDVVLEVRGLGRRGRFRDVSFAVRRGEIVGFAGLMGAGRTDVAEALFGLKPADAGEIRIHGRAVRIGSPRDAIANGVMLVSEDRKRYGVIPQMAVGQNITLASLEDISMGAFVSRSKECAVSDEQIRRFSIRVSSRDQEMRSLSGGNQQKAILARAMLTGPEVLILDEPTRGIDIGAKAEVYRIVRQLAREGKAIVVISSELPEVLALSHRILVMREGTIAAEVEPRQSNEEEILRYAMPS